MLFIARSLKQEKMVMVPARSKTKENLIFLLPTLTIVFQWISIAGINLSWLISGVLLISLLTKRKWILQKTIPLLFCLIFLVSPFLTFSFGIAPSFNFSLYISVAAGVIYFLYISTLETGLFKKFMLGGLFSCVLFAVWGCYEIFTGEYILSNHDIFTQRPTWNGMHYPIVAFSNTNDIAQYLALLFPISSYFLLRRHKFAWGVSSVLVFFVIYASGSRLCMICFVGVWGLSLFWKLMSDKRPKTIVTIMMIMLLIVIVLLVVEAKTGIISTLLDQFLVVDTSENYYSGREEIYTDILAVSARLPLGGFGSAYCANDFPPHNFLLFILCDFGWFAAIIFVVVLIKFGFKYYHVASLKRDDLFLVLLLSTLVLFPILSIVSSANEQRKIVWLMLGIFMNQYMNCRKVCEKNDAVLNNENRGTP